MNLDQRKLRLIQFLSELEDETFFDYIESVIESSGERFGIQLPEIQSENSSEKTEESVDKSENNAEKSGKDLLAQFYAKIGDFEDDETREHILRTEFTDDERFTILLMLRLEDVKNHPEQMIDEETFWANRRKRRQQKQAKHHETI